MAVKKKATSEAEAKTARAAIMEAVRKTIFKATKQKPIKPSEHQLAHVPTGSLAVDMLIGSTKAKDGKPICPGFPRRHITEIYGPEASGKTTLGLSGIVETQKAGGCAVFIDFEHALDMNYAKAVGVSFAPEGWQFYQPNDMEEGLTMAIVSIAMGVDIVVIDSVAGMVPKDEMTKKLTDPAKIGAVARILARDLPKFVTWLAKHPMEGPKEAKVSIEGHPGTALVVLNQTRALINTSGGRPGGDNENTSGGKALKFFAYLRLRLQRIKSEFIERNDPITGKKRRYPFGNVTIVKVVKSKVDAKQGHTTNIFIRYGYGIDDFLSIIEAGVTYKLIKKQGSYFEYKDHRFQGKEKFRKFLMEEGAPIFAELKEKLTDLIGDSADPAATAENVTDADTVLEQLIEEGILDDDMVSDEPVTEDVNLDDEPEPNEDEG